jgi:hypothetical protein
LKKVKTFLKFPKTFFQQGLTFFKKGLTFFKKELIVPPEIHFLGQLHLSKKMQDFHPALT